MNNETPRTLSVLFQFLNLKYSVQLTDIISFVAYFLPNAPTQDLDYFWIQF